MKMKNTKMLALIPALVIGISSFANAASSGFAGIAHGSVKTLKLSVEWSNLFGKKLPKLSTSSPLLGDEAAFRLEIGKYLSDYIANYKEIEGGGGFFREKRNLRDVQAEFAIAQADGTLTKKVVILAENDQNEEFVQLSELILNVGVELKGTVDVYRCLSPDNCVFDSVQEEQLFEKRRTAIAVHYNFQTLLNCRDARVEQATDRPEIRRLVINRTIARMIRLQHLITSKVQGVSPVFSANLENFGSDGLQNMPGSKMEAIHENDSLRLRRKHPLVAGGNWFDVYTFGRCF